MGEFSLQSSSLVRTLSGSSPSSSISVSMKTSWKRLSVFIWSGQS